MDRYLLISSDGHAGLPPEQYRGYLDPQFRAAFDVATRERTLETLRGVPEPELEAIFGGNALECYDLDRAALAAVAARIGPERRLFEA